MKFRLLILLLCASLLAASQKKISLSPDTRAVLDRITAADLRADLSFLASDEMQGRNTPSHELDIASVYLASQFRRYGLQPGGDDGYFQNAKMLLVQQPQEGSILAFEEGPQILPVPFEHVRVQPFSEIAFSHVPIWKVDMEQIDALTKNEVQGKALVVVYPEAAKLRAVMGMLGHFHEVLKTLNPAMVITFQTPRDISHPNLPALMDSADYGGQTTINVDLFDSASYKLFDGLKPGLTTATVSIHRAEAKKTPIVLHNVIGMLPGSDPVLKNTYVLVTAHYDHLGVKPAGEGDLIYNGANDDGSGTVSVIEIARALATFTQKPKRTLVFMTFFGEEKGEMGSRYYARHPIFPLEKTIADVNLEQLGRTDSTEGPQIANASFTGFDYSTLVPFFVAAGNETGVTVYKHPVNSDTYFGRSDNQSLASVGVPAHTVGVAFGFPDYHGVGDEWQKIDYENMAKIDRMLVLGLIGVANSPVTPKWEESNPKVEKYVNAWNALHKN